MFLILERISFLKAFVKSRWLIAKHIYTLLVVIIGWVFFRADSVNNALSFIKAMVGFGLGTSLDYNVSLYLNNEIIIAMILGMLASTPILAEAFKLQNKFVLSFHERTTTILNIAFSLLGEASLAFIFFAAVIKLAAGTYNPFIYFQF
jgi:alginate O-acetyltransferase complex protein AlgI